MLAFKAWFPVAKLGIPRQEDAVGGACVSGSHGISEAVWNCRTARLALVPTVFETESALSEIELLTARTMASRVELFGTMVPAESKAIEEQSLSDEQ